jgi:hypothetical protein
MPPTLLNAALKDILTPVAATCSGDLYSITLLHAAFVAGLQPIVTLWHPHKDDGYCVIQIQQAKFKYI